MRVRIANLIVATGALLISLMLLTGVGSRHPVPHGFTAGDVIAGLIVLYWFSGAVGLFFRSRLAWIGSLIGVGTSVIFFAAALVAIIGLYLFPNAEMHRIRDFGNAGYIAALVIGLGQFSILLALFLALFRGLLKQRKELR